MSVLYFLLLVGVLVVIHEMGHFVAAKLLDVKVLRRVIRERAKDQVARRAENETFDAYWTALNMGDLT